MISRPVDRRAFLLGALASWSFGSSRVRAWTSSPGPPTAGRTEDPHDAPSLVLVQLSGGNDGLNTIVPYGDDLYHRARRRIGIESDAVLRIDDYRGFHPELGGLRALYDEGKLALVEGVGYPRPSRSHFKSMDIWHAGDLRGRGCPEGWVGRLAGALLPPGSTADSLVHLGLEPPYSLHSREHRTTCFSDPSTYRRLGQEDIEGGIVAEPGSSHETGDASPEDTTSEANAEYLRSILAQAAQSSARVRAAVERFRSAEAFPPSPFGRALSVAAALLRSGIGCRFVSVEMSGFDTHAEQARKQPELLRQLDLGLSAFAREVLASPAGKFTAVLVFSEFGRRVAENASEGTDHGTAGPVLLMGERVRGGLHGAHPPLSSLDEGDLVHTMDFRRVYASVVEQHFGCDAEVVLGAGFAPLGLFSRGA